MRCNGWQGMHHQLSARTTIADPAAVLPPDLVDRQFAVDAPNRLLVADCTYVKLVTGVVVYVAFVIDACAGSIAPEVTPRQSDRRCYPPPDADSEYASVELSTQAWNSLRHCHFGADGTSTREPSATDCTPMEALPPHHRARRTTTG
jgi:hypothetical protein